MFSERVPLRAHLQQDKRKVILRQVPVRIVIRVRECPSTDTEKTASIDDSNQPISLHIILLPHRGTHLILGNGTGWFRYGKGMHRPFLLAHLLFFPSRLPTWPNQLWL